MFLNFTDGVGFEMDNVDIKLVLKVSYNLLYITFKSG